MSVLDRSALEASPLADLHTIASELSIDGYRRLRRPGLITAILAKQAGEPVPSPEDEPPSSPASPRSPLATPQGLRGVSAGKGRRRGEPRSRPGGRDGRIR